MKISNFIKSVSAAALVAFFSVSCDDNDDNNDEGTSRIRVSMTDAPGDYDEVNVEVVGLRYKVSNDDGEDGWVDLETTNTGVINLLDLTGGVTVLLADDEIPSGHLGQIRLILGDDNTVVKDGVTYPLNTPSAQQSGLKLQIDQELEADVMYEFLLDFDVNHSVVVQAGQSGNYNLHPVIRVTAEEASGSITGTIAPLDVPVMASIMVNGTEVSANTNDQGVFVIHGIPSGTYTLTLTPEVASGLVALTVENVTVVNGEETSVGNISL